MAARKCMKDAYVGLNKLAASCDRKVLLLGQLPLDTIVS